MIDLPHMIYAFWANDQWQVISSVVGTLFLLYLVARIGQAVFVLVQPSNLEIYCHSESGSWALVTGASDGIGRALSSELLKRGFNVLLHGRNPEKLDRVKKELSESYPKRSVEIVIADASRYENTYNDVVDKVRNLPGKLTILVNNVGGIMTKPQYVTHAEIPHDHIDSQLNLNPLTRLLDNLSNVRFPTHLTKALLPILEENKPSLILNCGSNSANMGVPYITTYCSSKAYNHAFSRALKTELVAEKIEQVEVLGVWIGNVTSGTNPHTLAFTISSQECAAGTLDRIGKSKAPLVYPHWKHAVQSWPLPFVPERFVRKFIIAEMSKRKDAERKEM